MSGKVIKILNNIRYIRSPATYCQTQIQQEAQPIQPPEKSPDRPYEAYVPENQRHTIKMAEEILGVTVVEIRSLRPKDSDNPVIYRQNRKERNDLQQR